MKGAEKRDSRRGVGSSQGLFKHGWHSVFPGSHPHGGQEVAEEADEGLTNRRAAGPDEARRCEAWSHQSRYPVAKVTGGVAQGVVWGSLAVWVVRRRGTPVPLSPFSPEGEAGSPAEVAGARWV